MNHSTTLFVGLDVHKISVTVAHVAAIKSPSAIRNKITLAGGVQILKSAGGSTAVNPNLSRGLVPEARPAGTGQDECSPPYSPCPS